MTTNDKDELILQMLKKGKSYTDIIAELSVSPSRIVVVKKRNVDALSSTNDALLGTTTVKKMEIKKEVKVVEPEVVLRKTIPPSPPPGPPVKKVVEPETKITQTTLPLSPLPPKKEVEEEDHIIEFKLSEIKSIDV